MNRIVAFIGSLLACLGCSQPGEDGKQIEASIRELSDSETDDLNSQRTQLLTLLHDRYPDVAGDDVVERLELIQRLHDDGAIASLPDTHPVGVIFGDALADRAGLHWVTVNWNGAQLFGLNYPRSTILVFPGPMVDKRIQRKEAVHFASLLSDTVSAIQGQKLNPEYQR